MGGVVSAIWRSIYGGDQECKVVIVGLSNAGKTTVLYRLNLGEFVESQPTIGSNVEEVKHKNIRFQAWDIGGGETMRGTWSSFFQDVDAVVFVVDSSDTRMIPRAKKELRLAMNSELLNGVPLLVFANKQDIRGSLTAAQISSELDLVSYKDRDWQIQAASAKSGAGLRDGFDWIATKIQQRSSVAASFRSALGVQSFTAGRNT